MKYLIFLAFFSVHAACLSASNGQDEAKKRIYNHLLIRDALSAVKEGKKAFEAFPDSKDIQIALIDALCAQGNETEALELWQKCFPLFQEEKIDRRMIEILAWGVLNKGEASSQLNIQLYALLGAAFTHDAKAIPLLIEQLQSSNALIRTVAIKLSTGFGDTPLKAQIARLLKDEKVWYVRLEVIQAVGALHMIELKSDLKEIIGNPKTLAEEKAAAIGALASMYDRMDREELGALTKSNRFGLRQLACEVITHMNLYEHLDLVLPLLNDVSPDVRVSALNTLALLRASRIGDISVSEIMEKKLHDASPEVSITASYALLLMDKKGGKECLEKWLQSENPKWRRMASAAIASSGAYGVKLSLKILKEVDDPYAKANAAIGLIGQRIHLKQACNVLYSLLSETKSQLWMWESELNPLFRSLAPSEVKHIEHIPHYPVVIDQLVRLDLLTMLSIVRYPQAQEAVKVFLQRRAWGVSGAAAVTLLQEGDEDALDAVRALLNDRDENIRVQAALILTLVGNDLNACKVLQEIYPHVDREMKVHILEAIAHVGDPKSIPFLLTVLKEPFQILRFVAASALIQCLSH
jgi:HEAT repeat protein